MSKPKASRYWKILIVPNINSGRPRAARSQNPEAPLDAITKAPSIRVVARTVKASKSAIYRIIENDGLYPYHRIRV
ncbi:hypothetical protein ILUMI_05484 [Ignelater luminosus]|uniref:Uncharacterized protein n=1 Tax=Ignelater luminosus TaxID=2038154 RepID=A0A8K0DCV7_IGNLU|nr:hypothetical protein ILUMI_05484 [Ignelater luminosus]